MPDLVRDDIRFGKIALGTAELLFQFIEESRVEVDFLVGGTVERADRRRSETLQPVRT